MLYTLCGRSDVVTNRRHTVSYETEQKFSAAEIADTLPGRERGNRIAPSTIYRWHTDGLHGVFLEGQQTGGRVHFSKEAVERFFLAVAEARRVARAKRKAIAAGKPAPRSAAEQTDHERAAAAVSAMLQDRRRGRPARATSPSSV
jgi:hypothetical protein